MPIAVLFSCSPARERISCVGGLVAARATSSQFSHTLRALFRKSALFFLLTPCQGERDFCADLLGLLAITQTCNKPTSSSSIIDHGSGAKLFVEYLHYSKRSG